MSLKYRGLVIIFASALFSYLLLLVHHWYLNEWWIETPVKYLAKFGSFTATILFCWNFILASRWKFLQRWFGGLDKMYRAHMWVGVASLGLILLHPLGLSLTRWPDISRVFSFWTFRDWVSNYASGHNIGIIALVILILLIWLTALKNLPYQTWKWTHRAFHVFLWLMIIHVILVDAEISRYIVLKMWYFAWFGVAILASIYSALYYLLAPSFTYTVESVEYFDDSIEIWLKPVRHHLHYLPSQFIYVSFFNPKISTELHPYSIGSAPNPEGRVKLGIKFLGDHTRSLCHLRKGDVAQLFGPFGNFSEKFLHDGKDCVFIGGGIGITPFMGMWQAALCSDEQVDVVSNPGRFSFAKEKVKEWKSPHVYLCYLVKNEQEATFLNDIESIAICSQYKGFRNYGLRGHQFDIHYSQTHGRLKLKDLSTHMKNFTQRNFFMCGPKPMIDGMISELLKMGVKKSQIVVEDFNYRDMSPVVGVFSRWWQAMWVAKPKQQLPPKVARVKKV